MANLEQALEDGELSADECAKLFDRYDSDKSGSIERKEVRLIVADVLKAKGQDAKEVDEMMSLGAFEAFEQQLFHFLDKGNKDGKIDKEEFLKGFPDYITAMVREQKAAKKVAELSASLRQAMKSGAIDEKECAELFARYDADSSGSIERGEVKFIIGDLLKAKGQDAKEVDEMLDLGGFVSYEEQVFKFFDKGDKDGKIDKAEFIATFPKYVKAMVDKAAASAPGADEAKST